jgi:hypothetical protein
MNVEVIWIPLGTIAVLYILYLQFQIWWRDRIIEYTTRPPRDDSELGCGGLLVSAALLVGIIYLLLIAAR